MKELKMDIFVGMYSVLLFPVGCFPAIYKCMTGIYHY